MYDTDLGVIYLVVLISAGCLTLIYLLFSEMLDGVFEGIPLIDPAVILSFITLTAASGYLFEKFSNLSSISVFIISCGISAIISTFIYFFILVPIRSAEVSLAYTEESLGGQTGKVIVPIPENGYGEIVIETVNGVISKRATGFNNEFIDYEEQVLIIEAKEGTVYVKKYESPYQIKL
ncbi:hypothetical protein D1B33_08710 [Lysinibacillus yapensis]|uniref:Membrane protein NfeD2 N-terminal transmembrane domain-containing protein n=1 Tax=Ureibacillus yapensis TaxID=2304605 RepID=A0A396SD06_9BACL|nr:hypothetical protein D1B33_08710 [Lysinibacillus yapensis]